MLFVYNVGSCDYMDVSPVAKFGGPRHCGNEDIWF